MGAESVGASRRALLVARAPAAGAGAGDLGAAPRARARGLAGGGALAGSVAGALHLCRLGVCGAGARSPIGAEGPPADPGGSSQRATEGSGVCHARRTTTVPAAKSPRRWRRREAIITTNPIR